MSLEPRHQKAMVISHSVRALEEQRSCRHTGHGERSARDDGKEKKGNLLLLINWMRRIKAKTPCDSWVPGKQALYSHARRRC